MLNQETLTDTTQLAAEARAAYDQKRMRECIALTKTLALADPGNTDVQELQAAIRADIQQDVHDARTLLEQSGTPDEKKKYRKAAEIILIKTVNLDPDNGEAKALLQSARAVPGSPPPAPAPTPVPAPTPAPPVVAHANPQPHSHPSPHKKSAEDELSFVAAPTLFKPPDKKKKRGLKLPLGLILTVLGGGALLRVAQSHQSNPTSLASSVNRNQSLSQINFQPSTKAANSASSLPVSATVTPASVQLSGSSNPAPVETAALTVTATAPNPAPVPTVGTLAVSSPIAAEIYQNGKLLGSTPITLQLPAGRQTLEYRHGDLRTVVNHDIKSNETTAASVTFQTSVQVNAKPWAQVFLDGAQRRPLGQTPLSNVSVPIGGVLVFENPNFASKTYRVTEKDSAIQVDFQ